MHYGGQHSAGAQNYTVTGRKFTGTTSVKFGTTEATGFTIDTDGQLTVTSPALVAGDYNLYVTNAEGTTKSVQQITII